MIIGHQIKIYVYFQIIFDLFNILRGENIISGLGDEDDRVNPVVRGVVLP
jgi:hypothetical protein